MDSLWYLYIFLLAKIDFLKKNITYVLRRFFQKSKQTEILVFFIKHIKCGSEKF